MVTRILVGLALATSLAVPAVAQQASPAPIPSREVLARQASLATTWERTQSYRLVYEQDLIGSSGNKVNASLERVDLANRVSGLIQLGRCEEAGTLAREAGDRLMSVRARQLCRAQRN